MKTAPTLRLFFAAICASIIAVSFASAQLTWDHNADGTASDGSGTWLNPNQWLNGAVPTTWSNATPDSASIGSGGTGGTITVGTVVAGSVLLDNFSGTYNLNSGSLNQSGGITVGPDAGNVTTNIAISGTGGITMNGSGLLNVRSSVLTYTGPTVVNSGVMMFFHQGSLPTGNFTLNNGMLTDYYRRTHTFANGLGTGTSQIQIYGDSGFGSGNGNGNWRIGANNSVLTWGALGEGAATGFFNPNTLKLRAPIGDNNGTSIYGQVTLQNGLDLNGGARTIDVFEGTGPNATVNAWGNIAGAIVDNSGGGGGSLVKTGGGILRLSGANTYAGGTTINDGTIEMRNASALGSSSGTLTVNSGGTLKLINNNLTIGNLTGTGGTIANDGANDRNLTIGNGSTGGGDFQGVIADATGAQAGKLALTKTGTGIITLSGANTYSGGTLVSAGTLLVNNAIGSGTGSGDVIVGSGGTLGGTGFIVGNTIISGTHSPGSSPGILNHVGNLSYTTGSNVIWELVDNTRDLADRGTVFDGINVNGDLDFAGPTALDLVFDFTGSTVDWSDPFWTANYFGADGWLLYEVTGGTISNFDNLAINTIDWLDGDGTPYSGVPWGKEFDLYLDGNNIYLTYTPEPSKAILLALGLLGLLARRRR